MRIARKISPSFVVAAVLAGALGPSWAYPNNGDPFDPLDPVQVQHKQKEACLIGCTSQTGSSTTVCTKACMTCQSQYPDDFAQNPSNGYGACLPKSAPTDPSAGSNGTTSRTSGASSASSSPTSSTTASATSKPFATPAGRAESATRASASQVAKMQTKKKAL